MTLLNLMSFSTGKFVVNSCSSFSFSKRKWRSLSGKFFDDALLFSLELLATITAAITCITNQSQLEFLELNGSAAP
jgi:hypothetical protein